MSEHLERLLRDLSPSREPLSLENRDARLEVTNWLYDKCSAELQGGNLDGFLLFRNLAKEIALAYLDDSQVTKICLATIVLIEHFPSPAREALRDELSACLSVFKFHERFVVGKLIGELLRARRLERDPRRFVFWDTELKRLFTRKFELDLKHDYKSASLDRPIPREWLDQGKVDPFRGWL